MDRWSIALPRDNDEAATISQEFAEQCYAQFHIIEVCDFRLSMKDLEKTERDMFLMGKLQLYPRDPDTVVHSPELSRPQRNRGLLSSTHSITELCVKVHFVFFTEMAPEFTLPYVL